MKIEEIISKYKDCSPETMFISKSFYGFIINFEDINNFYKSWKKMTTDQIYSGNKDIIEHGNNGLNINDWEVYKEK